MPHARRGARTELQQTHGGPRPPMQTMLGGVWTNAPWPSATEFGHWGCISSRPWGRYEAPLVCLESTTKQPCDQDDSALLTIESDDRFASAHVRRL